MPIQNKTILKGYFETGDKPTEENFTDLIDSLCDDTSYDVSWASVTDTAPSKRSVYEKLESLEVIYKTTTLNISGNVTIDLSVATIFFLTLTGNVTSFNYSNEIVGREYVFYFIKGTTNYAFTWSTGRYRFPFKVAPVLTNPTTNGTSPANSVDIITSLCSSVGRLDIVITPDLQNN